MKLGKKATVIFILTVLTMGINLYIERKLHEGGVYGIDVFEIIICLLTGFGIIFMVGSFTVMFLWAVLNKEPSAINSDTNPDIHIILMCSPLLIYNLLIIFWDISLLK